MKTLKSFMNILFELVYNFGLILGGSKWENDNMLSAYLIRLITAPLLVYGGGSLLATISRGSSFRWDLMALLCGALLFSLGSTFILMIIGKIMDIYCEWRFDKIKNSD